MSSVPLTITPTPNKLSIDTDIPLHRSRQAVVTTTIELN